MRLSNTRNEKKKKSKKSMYFASISEVKIDISIKINSPGQNNNSSGHSLSHTGAEQKADRSQMHHNREGDSDQKFTKQSRKPK